jgi:hypothetical protein
MNYPYLKVEARDSSDSAWLFDGWLPGMGG